MKIAEVKSMVHERLCERLADRGFVFRKTNSEYVSKRGDIRHIFRIQVLAMTEWFRVAPEAFVGCPEINKMFNDILGRRNDVNGATCGFSVENECSHQRGHYSINSDQDVATAAEACWQDYLEVAAPFFERMDSVAAIDQYLNTAQEEKGCSAGSIGLACKGLIAAKIVENPKLSDLARKYYEFWSKAQSPALASEILTVKKAFDGTTALIKAQPPSAGDAATRAAPEK